jgi:hypothetical protein
LFNYADDPLGGQLFFQLKEITAKQGQFGQPESPLSRLTGRGYFIFDSAALA